MCFLSIVGGNGFRVIESSPRLVMAKAWCKLFAGLVPSGVRVVLWQQDVFVVWLPQGICGVLKAAGAGVRAVWLPGWQSLASGSQGPRTGSNSCQLGSQITHSPNISADLKER
jgi:hypothetical protein